MTASIAFPLAIASNGRTAKASGDDALAQMLEQIVFVEPGERVNRPAFGCNLIGLTFLTGQSEIAAAIGTLVQSALRQWTERLIEVTAVDVAMVDSAAVVTIVYRDLRTLSSRTVRLRRSRDGA